MQLKIVAQSPHMGLGPLCVCVFGNVCLLRALHVMSNYCATVQPKQEVDGIMDREICEPSLNSR